MFEEEEERQDATTNAKTLSNPQAVELTCVLERALVYATTGNGKTLDKGSMEPLLLIKGILNRGFPALPMWERMVESNGDTKYNNWGHAWQHWGRSPGAGGLRPFSSAIALLGRRYGSKAAIVIKFPQLVRS